MFNTQVRTRTAIQYSVFSCRRKSTNGERKFSIFLELLCFSFENVLPLQLAGCVAVGAFQPPTNTYFLLITLYDTDSPVISIKYTYFRAWIIYERNYIIYEHFIFIHVPRVVDAQARRTLCGCVRACLVSTDIFNLFISLSIFLTHTVTLE